MPVSRPACQFVVVATAIALAMGISAPASATEIVSAAGPVPVTETPPGPAPSDDPVPTVAPESEMTPPNGGEIIASDPEALAYLLNCKPDLRADRPHISTFDKSGDLSSHGYWNPGRCRDKRAPIVIHLQAYFTDHTWKSRGTLGTALVRPGGGAGKRATARAHCVTPQPVTWRTWAVIHTPSGGIASKYSVTATLPCSPGR